MRGARKLAIALAIAALLSVGLGACGGGDSGDSSVAATATVAPETTPATGGEGGSEGAAAAKKGSAGFRTPGGDNSIQNFGEEANAAETAAASAVLANYLRARAKDDWAGECAYLAKGAVAPLVQLASRSPRLEGKGCAAILAALSAGAPTSLRANTMTAGIASLRLEGDRGFALYHGARGVDYFVPMVREDGEWTVGALAPSEFP